MAWIYDDYASNYLARPRPLYALLWVIMLSCVLDAAQACVAGAGTYCPGALGAPVACPPGYYCLADGSGLMACPSGSANGRAGQSDASACVACTGTSVALTTGAELG